MNKDKAPTVTYTEGAMACAGDTPGWSSRLAPGAASRGGGGSITPNSGPGSAPRPVSVPTGYLRGIPAARQTAMRTPHPGQPRTPWDSTTSGGRRITRPKCASSMLSDRRWNLDVPHQSFDIDGDGYVDRNDYELANRFDEDSNGLIDAEELHT